MKNYDEMMKECKKINSFLEGKTISTIKWWADSLNLSPTLVFTDGSSMEIIGEKINYKLNK